MSTKLLIAQSIDNLSLAPKTSSDKAIALSHLDISVFVLENIATTTLEMRFFNPNNRIMEGELNFPLAEGVTVSRFALDVNGEMREGVVVEKEKAIQAFEAITRQNVDPGLVQVTKGNNFKARVYPIPAKGYKKALIAFEQELSGDSQNYLYQLPLNITQALEEFCVRVEVVMNEPKVIQGKHPLINLNFTQARESYISEYKATNATLEKHLSFAIPKPQRSEKSLTYRGSVTSDNFFYLNLNLQPEQRTKEKPKSLALLWDVSSSGNARNLEKELQILQDYLKWVGKGKVNVKTFSFMVHDEQDFQISSGKCDPLIEYLTNQNYDGGTNLSAVSFNEIKADEVLLFSDGLSTFGEKATFNCNVPLLVFNSALSADHSLLSYYAMASGGLYINSIKLTTPEVIELATNQQKQFIRADYDTEKISKVFPATAQSVTDHFSCSGIMEGATSDITLHFGFGNSITESHKLTVDNSQARSEPLGERIWAQKKLQNLLIADDHEAIKAHGKKFSLVTAGTSLIVLDALEDYIRYEIIPPASMQKEYYARISQRDNKNIEEKQNRLAQLCEQFKLDYEWWTNVIDYRNVKEEEKKPELPKKVMEEEMLDTEGARDEGAPVDNFESANEEREVEEEMVERSLSMDRPSPETRAPRAKLKAKKTSQAVASVQIKAWDSNAPYINALKSVNKEDMYASYLLQKPEYEDVPSFYFDVATYLLQKGLKVEGLRVISNLAELELENVELLRTLGRKLFEFKFHKEALSVFKEVMQSRSFEPHSYIDLGLTYAEIGEYQKAVDYLYTVVEKNWDSDIISRFPGIELISVHDINNIIFHHPGKVNTTQMGTCYLKHMPVDMRIVIDWDANDTDIDLWITDPRDEKCSYSNQNTVIGGRISNDITQGYGPEEFRLKHAIDGKYIIEAKFFGSRKQTLQGKVTTRAFVYTNFGTEREQKQVLTLQLDPNKGGEYTVGEIEFKSEE